AGERYAGLTVMQARERVVADLEAQGLVRAREEYAHTVPFSQRSGERVEPLISLQWFMRMDELAAPAIDVVQSGRVRIHPESQSKRYLDWLAEIRPWCVSRQLWWGHQIPVWYRGSETHCAMTAPEGDGWTQDPDVLDTWFSSALWPFATLGWPEQTADLQAFYPTDVLSTARDILFLWVARMVMMGLRFAGDVPFSDVYVHSIIQAPDGRRMSKSLGTGIDPLDLIDGGPRPPVFTQGGDFPAYGADAVRFGLLAMSSTQDVRFSEEKIAQGQALANKLYNATRFVALRVGGGGDGDAAPQEGRFRVGAPQPRTVEDRWILSRLQAIEADTQARVDGFDFAKAALGLYDFVYGDLCDWYLELVKPRLSDDADPGERAALGATLLHVLRETIATAHPIVPFVTEELWDLLGYTDAEGLLAASSLPQPDDALRDPAAEAEMERAIEAIKALRAWRDSVGVKAGAIVPGVLRASGYDATAARVAGLARFSFAGDTRGGDDGGEPVATIAIPGGAVGVLASDAVDLGAADRRLEQARETLAGEIDRAHRKLANAGFVAKAPAAVVDAERAKLERLRCELAALEQPAGR
ncbi:MAG TPA: class I tRNA ligase family protein, partial [Solirubrobacteraceae bacterium]|nr:class I tRNA ligase family protein [Solirubrobacteraceae bacterium]